MTLNEFFENIYRPLKLRGKSLATVRLYGNTLKQYAKFLGHTPTVEEDLTDLQIARYLEARGRYRSPLTAEKERNQLCALWRCAADQCLLKARPCLPPATIPFRVPTAWSIEQLQSLLTAAKAAPGMIGDVPARIYWPALIQTLWQSAERVGAILAVEKVDYTKPMILVRAEYRKGGKRDKLYSFTPGLCELLDILVRSNLSSTKLFAWPKDRLYLWQRFGKIVAAAGLDKGRRNKFHQLRRSAATHFAAAGGDPVALLDHSSPRITRAYLDPRYVDTGPKPCDVLPSID